ncbi:MAG: cell division protein ZapA, partial [Bacteroidetes bacterium]|nr:cell division protein ZapA [Bacteroidota bacterium]
YAYKDKQDLLAMISLQFASYAVNYENSAKNSEHLVIEKLTELDEILEGCLNKV